MNFKVGDWVSHFCEDTPMQITKVYNNGKSNYRVDCGDVETWSYVLKLWQPKESELFWGYRELSSEYMYKSRIELFMLYKIHNDGTYSLKSPLDKNVYSYYIEHQNIEEFISKCEPFLGNLPSFVKEMKI